MSISKTFCSAPWFQVRIDGTGDYRPCCEIDVSKSKFTKRVDYHIDTDTVDEYMSSEYLQYLRKELDTGKPEECASCWKKESAGLPSLRHFVNNSVTKNQGNSLDQTWIPAYLKHTNSYASSRIVSADIKLSNVCNFACAMCNPKDSSKIFDQWINDQDNEFVKDILDKNPSYFSNIVSNYQGRRGYAHLKNILTHPITQLKLLGGEPLLDKELFSILESVPATKQKDITLLFVTNGSQDLVKAANRLSGFKSVIFVVSLEGVGVMQDYIREGSRWDIIEKNILEASKHNIDIIINHTVQAATILRLSELILWCQANNILINFSILSEPEHLSLSVLPSYIKLLAINKLKLLSNITIIGTNDTESNSVESLCNIIRNSDNKEYNYNKFLNYYNWYDKHKSIKLAHICPELT